MPINAEQAERWGLVNYVVDRSELSNKARQIAEAIIKNNHDMVLRYKAVINDGFKQELTRALALEKVPTYVLVMLNQLIVHLVQLFAYDLFLVSIIYDHIKREPCIMTILKENLACIVVLYRCK